MNLSRSKTVWLIVVLALAVLSLRPEPFVEKGFTLALAPVRVLTALASPLGFAGSVRAALEDDALERELNDCRTLAEDYRRHAQPTDPALRGRATRVDAEVIARGDDSLDRIVVRLLTTEGVEIGAPVVCRDAFVGRLVSFDPIHPRQAKVELLTGKSFRVGAYAEGSERSAELVVGGLAPDTRDRGLHLAVHNPSDRSVQDGIVRVSEPRELLLDVAGAELADGFSLGELRTLTRRSDQVLAIRPALDFESGLFHVLVLIPHERAPSVAPLAEDLFDQRAWHAAKILLRGELSAWRSGRKLSVGQRAGVEPGAALRSGARFVGRVQRSGLTFSDVQLLGDPGFSFPALARVEEGELVVLGRLVCVASPDPSVLTLRWKTHKPIEVASAFGKGEVAARVFTGSGSAGVPLGLLVGDTLLPTGAGTHLLTIELGEPLDSQRNVSVRVRRAETTP